MLQKGSEKAKLKVQLLGSGAILREVIAAAELLQKDFNVSTTVWSVTSFTELRRDALKVERENNLNPDKEAKLPYVTQCLMKQEGPVIAASDYMRAFADQIRLAVPQNYYVLGTDGFGRSDTREQLRHFFEVNRFYIAVAALSALAKDKIIASSQVTKAIKKYNIDPGKPNPATV